MPSSNNLTFMWKFRTMCSFSGRIPENGKSSQLDLKGAPKAGNFRALSRIRCWCMDGHHECAGAVFVNCIRSVTDRSALSRQQAGVSIGFQYGIRLSTNGRLLQQDRCFESDVIALHWVRNEADNRKISTFAQIILISWILSDLKQNAVQLYMSLNMCLLEGIKSSSVVWQQSRKRSKLTGID